MRIREHKLININEILVNPENPRHNPVMDIGESFVMQQLVSNNREANAMYKLITDIFKDGWYPQSIITVTYDEIKRKYIAWDGNRRLTALKILQNPELTNTFKAFNYTQIRGIYNMSKGIKDQSFFEVLCYVSPTFKDCAGYIRNIHTNDTGALRWDTASIKRFEEKLGIKNIFTQLQGYCPKAFDSLEKDFPVSKFEKIVSSKIGKEYLQIEFINNTLTCLSSVEELEEKVSRIIKDIIDNKISTETVKNINNIKHYLYPKEETINNIKQSEKEIKNDKEERNISQLDIFGKELYGSSKIKNQDTSNNQEMFESNKNTTSFRVIKKNEDIIFRNINISKINNSNERANGIKSLAYEIQHMSNYNQYKRYPISYCFLIRSLLEQTSIYFLINANKWEKLKKGNNNKDLRLESIIKYISSNKTNLIQDDTILRCWESCFNFEGTKDYLDLVIHHPYKVIANIEAIKSITDMGLYAIIQYLINN